ncbi:MAG: hypothetical protein MUO68_07040, partial [Desulfobacteraceae bacterium]|nr:hypothetical protein [Desulfobacteraceae bacterium]
LSIFDFEFHDYSPFFLRSFSKTLPYLTPMEAFGHNQVSIEKMAFIHYCGSFPTATEGRMPLYDFLTRIQQK